MRTCARHRRARDRAHPRGTGHKQSSGDRGTYVLLAESGLDVAEALGMLRT
jgi:hypothetical protein